MVIKDLSSIKPEKKVQQEIMSWCFQNHWSVSVFDSKAILDKTLGVVRNPGLSVGCPDIVGVSDIGFGVFLELKRKNGENICRLSQYQFLTQKIESNAFGVVVSSSEKLEEIYKKWLSLRQSSFDEARKYLLQQLPKKVIVNKKIISLI